MQLITDSVAGLQKAESGPGLLLGQDYAVAAWAFQHFNVTYMYVTKAYGVIDAEGKLAGAAIFHNCNGINCEFIYLAPFIPTLGMFRYLARVALEELQVERVTLYCGAMHTALIRHFPKFGAIFEGVQQRFYGRDPGPQNTAVHYVLFREHLMRLAGPDYLRRRRAAMN